jgi:hypothetical protein
MDFICIRAICRAEDKQLWRNGLLDLIAQNGLHPIVDMLWRMLQSWIVAGGREIARRLRGGVGGRGV